ncbi:MAG TPA: ATP-binding domain-containing protein [Acidimicrobiia bacterium]|nr:ATP-binding domain-containing protein [Acidimicrobiia bacterium]
MTDELAAEQAVVDEAYAALAAMRARTQDVFDRIMSTGGFQDLDHEVAIRRRIASLGDSPRPLVFGRIDEESGDRWYIGRRHVEDAHADPLVVEWRTPVAEPFYQARAADPRGLVRRRQLMLENRRVQSLADDVFGAGAGALGDVRLRGGDALLAELERGRTGVMLDIVATIQAEQDDVIRAPLAGVVAVQGGPGTGKTAIGLHRAAFLLYNHPELARSEVMVLGPSRAFLGYVAQVLPSLGEEAVLQVTLADLVPEVTARGADAPVVQIVKGDARLAMVLARAVAARRAHASDGFVVRLGLRRAAVEGAEVDELVAEQVARGVPYRVGRAALRTRLVNLVYRRMGLLDADLRDVTTEIRASDSLRQALDRVWPAVSPRALVRDLLSDAEQLTALADGVLDAEEQAALLRARNAPWTASDIPLLDEARALLEGRGATYGHVIVDEAQDLSPMQLRMIARRAPSGSVTVLGDLAQATAAWAHETWADVVAHLATPDGWRAADLTLGYRVPGQVLDYASLLLQEAAPQVPLTESVRRGDRPPRVVEAEPAALLDTAAAEAAALAAQDLWVGCIVAPEQEAAAADAFRERGVDFGVPERDGILRRITVLPAPTAKGLEFDAVVVVEPAAIAAGGARGLRLLYVALTRPTRRLTVLHARPLPGALARFTR